MTTVDEALEMWDLTFRKWREAREHQMADWTVVARLDKQGEVSLGTFGVLVPNEPDAISRVFSVWEWQFYMHEVGQPGFVREGGSDTVALDLALSMESEGIRFEPFVIYRYFHGLVPERLDLVQDFGLLYNLYEAEGGGVMRTLRSDGNEEEVARTKSINEKSIRLEVSTAYLRDYLASRGRALIRYHDHTVFLSEVRLDGDKLREFEFRDDSSFYHVWIGESALGRGLVANLRGKDIIRPFPEPIHEEYQQLKGTVAREYEKFVVGMDDHGKPVEIQCNPDSEKFLNLVFFRKQVLQKYYDLPTKYRVSSSRVTCLDLWSIPYDINEADVVYAYLGDLGRLSTSEQKHWKSYNVTPVGGMTARRFKTDFEAQFAEDTDPVSLFKRAMTGIRETTRQSLGFDLIKELRAEDRHALVSLHVPLTDEWAEFDAQVQYLAKVTVDSIDVEMLKHQLEGTVPSTRLREMKSLDLLEQFLQAKGAVDSRDIVKPLRRLQQVRSASAAHRKGSEFDRLMMRMGLNVSTAAARFRLLLQDATDALQQIGTATITSEAEG